MDEQIRKKILALLYEHRIMTIATGLSMAARAKAVVDREEAEKVLRMLLVKYPEQVSLPGRCPVPMMSVYSA